MLAFSFSFPQVGLSSEGLILSVTWERLLEFAFEDTPALVLCKRTVTPPRDSVVCLCWYTPTSQLLAFWSFDSVTSSFHSQLWLATLQPLLKALLALFYSVTTGHFDLLSFVVTPCRKTASQLSSVSYEKKKVPYGTQGLAYSQTSGTERNLVLGNQG